MTSSYSCIHSCVLHMYGTVIQRLETDTEARGFRLLPCHSVVLILDIGFLISITLPTLVSQTLNKIAHPKIQFAVTRHISTIRGRARAVGFDFLSLMCLSYAYLALLQHPPWSRAPCCCSRVCSKEGRVVNNPI